VETVFPKENKWSAQSIEFSAQWTIKLPYWKLK